jgi:putative ABC transport system permease protein
VAAIALVLALGLGVHAGLGSTATWRRESNDASYAALHMFDLKASLTAGTFTDRGSLLVAAARVPGVAEAEERLVVATSVDASTGGDAVLVPGRIIGVDLASTRVNTVDVLQGRALRAGDEGAPVALLEEHFARFHDLPPTGHLRLSGDARLRYVGTALAAEYLMVTTENGNFLAEANFAVVLTSLRTAQELAGRVGQVNDLVVRLRPGTDVQRARTALAAALPAARVTTRADDAGHRILYEDIKGDQKFWNVIAGLILLGAVIAAFNLGSRMVEAQRRQIGVSMALGVPPWRIALRPLLAGAEIAVLGTTLGIGVGVLVMWGMQALFQSMLPLPVWRMQFQLGPFVQAITLGLILPVVATAWPVWRAVRVPPVDALRTGHLAVRSLNLVALARRLPVGRSSTIRMPFRNVLRAPRRTVMTARGVGASITAHLGALGLIDSIHGTKRAREAEALRASPHRLEVELDAFQPVDAPVVRAVGTAPVSGRTSPGLRLAGLLQANGASVEALVDVIDLNRGLWRPTVQHLDGRDVTSGLVLSKTAADDLGVRPGGRVMLVHPKVTSAGATLTSTKMTVVAVHPGPMRFATYLDVRQAGPVFGLAGMVNRVVVEPAAGSTEDDVERGLFGLAGVTSVQPAWASTKLFEDAIGQFVGILRFLEGFVLLLALLIAFNASSISADERRRDHATMFAFGLRVRTVVRMNVMEGLATGILGTAIGIGVGSLVLRWMVGALLPNTMPELRLTATLSTGTIGTALALGVLAVAIAPLLTYRRLQRMDVPAALRVLE